VTILLTTALGIGLYLIASTKIIAEDGVTFIQYAKGMTVNATETMIRQDQHPGYPALIVVGYKLISIFVNGATTSTWIYAGQGMTLLFRVFSIIVFYFLADYFLKDRRKAFIAALIVLFLPDPAHFGSDCLSDWPHLFFLLLSFSFLVKAAKNNRIILFCFSGITSGIGYLIRPECAQVIPIGAAWLAFQFFYPKRSLSIPKIFTGVVLMLAGFAIFAGPYMHLKGALLPKKHIGTFTSITDHHTNKKTSKPTTASPKLDRYWKALGKLCDNTARTFMYFFLPAVVIGLAVWLKKNSICNSDKFLITAALLLNFAILFWLYNKHHYMSIRHTMPMLIITALFIPIGFEKIMVWLSGKRFQKELLFKNTVIITLMGLAICSVRLFRPIHWDKGLYIEAANWIKENTAAGEEISSFDSRIAFYADRKCSLNGSYQVIKLKSSDISKIDNAVKTFSSSTCKYKLVIKKHHESNAKLL